MEAYKHIADLFRYPTAGILPQLDQVSQFLEQKDAFLHSEFQPFHDFFTNNSITSLEEYYIRTFDVRAICHLDIGYVIFGDDSKRGRFLYHMKEEQIQAGNDCGSELADFLPNMLSLLSKTDKLDLAEELSVSILLPALSKILQKLESESNIYKIPMGILISLLEQDFENSEYEAIKIGTKDKPGYLNHYVTGIDKSLFEKKPYKLRRDV
jgi:nitrate reductase assembly molybdenum cofactor insertion protein NarJ